MAVVGSGISGLLCARLLATRHDVTLFEANETLGGHTRTVDVETFGSTWAVDTGFMVFNDHTYPNFIRMLDILGIDSQESDMSFSVRCERTSLEYQGSSLNGLFAQRANLLRPRFYRMLADIVRFNRRSIGFLKEENTSISVKEFLAENKFSESFASHYLLPMTAAIWSAPTEGILDFPANFLLRFLQNHGLLQLRNRPQWKTIPGGAKRYVHRLAEPLGERMRINSSVTSAVRHEAGVSLTVAGEVVDDFDHVVFASHAPQTLQILQNATPEEIDILSKFQYQRNIAILHTDTSQLPSHKRAWASWNYRSNGDSRQPVSVTYDLSRLQRVHSPTPILLTLNPCTQIAKHSILREMSFDHPLFTDATHRARKSIDDLHKDGRIFFCGAYWGYGFHEDGVRSALQVCSHFGIDLEDLSSPCKAAYTKVG